MIAIIYAGLAIFPLGLLIFGCLFLKTRYKTMNVPVLLSAGIVTLVVEFIIFNSLFSEAIKNKLWNSVSSVISVFPFLASLSMLAVCLVIHTTSEFLQFKNKNISVKIALFFGFALVFTRFGLQQLPYLTTDFKTINQLVSSDCSEEIIREFAAKDNIDFNLAIIANKNIPKDLINQFSQSTNEMIRYYSTASLQLSNERLQQMKATDPSKEVRKQAENELKFSRNIVN